MLSGTRSRPPVWCQPAPSQINTAWAPGVTWAAMLEGDDVPTGRFFRDGKPIGW